jgi:hypothetical protein
MLDQRLGDRLDNFVRLLRGIFPRQQTRQSLPKSARERSAHAFVTAIGVRIEGKIGDVNSLRQPLRQRAPDLFALQFNPTDNFPTIRAPTCLTRSSSP